MPAIRLACRKLYGKMELPASNVDKSDKYNNNPDRRTLLRLGAIVRYIVPVPNKSRPVGIFFVRHKMHQNKLPVSGCVIPYRNILYRGS